jgi:hypothetical protein
MSIIEKADRENEFVARAKTRPVMKSSQKAVIINKQVITRRQRLDNPSSCSNDS